MQQQIVLILYIHHNRELCLIIHPGNATLLSLFKVEINGCELPLFRIGNMQSKSVNKKKTFKYRITLPMFQIEEGICFVKL